MAQPQIRRNTWDGPPGGRSVVDARATELLHVYIYDYCKKHNFHQAARSFAAEANISTDQQPPIDIATGFLADWWGVFWDVYHAKNKDAQATKEAGIHDEYHELLRNRKEEVLQQQRNFSMQQAVQQQQQQRRASEAQRLAQSPQLQHPLHGQQQDPQQQQQQQQQAQAQHPSQQQPRPQQLPSQQQQQQQQQQPHVPSQQQQQQQAGQSRDHRPSPASSTASLPNNSSATQGNNNVNSMVNTPQTIPTSLPQQHPGNRLGAPSPSFSPQQMQRPGAGNAAGNENMPGHPEAMMNSPMVSAQGIPMSQGQMMMNQRPNITQHSAIIQNSMSILGFGGREPHTLNPEERAALQMQVRKQTMFMNQSGMMRNPNMMVTSQAQSRLQMQQQLMMNHPMYQQQQQQQQQQPQMQQGQQQGQHQPQTQQGQPQAPQPQPQQHLPGQPSIPSQQAAGPQQNPQAPQPHPQGAGPQQQPQPQQGVPQTAQQGQPGQHPSAASQTGNGARPPGAMVPGSGTPNSSGPGQMHNPNMIPGQFGGGEVNMMLAQQMMKNGPMTGLTPQQQQQQQQQFLAQQQHQRMLFNQRRMMQHQQITNQGGQTPPNPNMGSPNPPAPMNAGSPQDEKNRTPLALYQRRQMHYIMQQQHQDQQRQQYVQQQHGQTPPPPQQQQQQQMHPTKRQRPNPDIENPNGPQQGATQSPQMGMASPHVMNAAQTPQNTSNLPGSTQASPVMSMQQRVSQQQQQHQQSPFNQDPNARPSQSPQMNRNLNKAQQPNQTPQQLPQQLPMQGTPKSGQQGIPPAAAARMGWNPSAQGPGGDMQSPGMAEGDQSPAAAQVATPGGNGGAMNSGPANNMMSFDLERFMMSDGGDFGEIFTAGDDGGENNLLMGGDNNEMFGGGFLASMGGGFGGDASSSLGGMDNAASLQLYSELTGHNNKVSTVALSPDGQWLASAGHDKKVLIWAVHDKLLRWTLEGHNSQITCARWSPDQRNLLVTSSYDKTLRVWDLGQAMKDGGQGDVKQIAKFECKAPITAVDFAPDRPDTICSLDAEGELNVWHISSSKSEKTIKMAASKSLFAANPLRFHPRLGKILACAAGNQLFVIDIDMAKNNASSADTAAVRTINADHSKNICSLDWSADGNYLVASSENAVMVYETGQWKLVNRHTATDKISACAFVMPTSGNNSNSNGGVDSSAAGVTGAEKLRVVYGSYEAIYVWQCSVPGSQPKRAGAQSGMVTGLACINTNGQTIVASASHNKEKNLMLWTL